MSSMSVWQSFTGIQAYDMVRSEVRSRYKYILHTPSFPLTRRHCSALPRLTGRDKIIKNQMKEVKPGRHIEIRNTRNISDNSTDNTC